MNTTSVLWPFLVLRVLSLMVVNTVFFEVELAGLRPHVICARPLCMRVINACMLV